MANTTFPESPLEFGMFDWIEASGQPLADIFEHKMQLVEAADQGGFYGWHIAEHQATPLSLNISPSVLLASAIQRTERLRMGAMTFCLPWYDPHRFYNEICMLDQLSRGRIEMGVGRGVSLLEGAVYGITDLEDSRNRYREMLDIFMTACGPDVLNYDGQYHSYHDVELYNHPFQRPYPPLWFPSSNRDSVEFTARHGYNTVLPGGRDAAQRYREIWLEHKDDPGRHNAHVPAPKLAGIEHIVVADTDAEAEALATPAHAVWFEHITHLWRRRGVTPPFGSDRDAGGGLMMITGAPQTVAQVITDKVKESTLNYIMLVFSFGDLKPEHAQHSMDLFIKEAMPAIRSAVGSAKEAAAG